MIAALLALVPGVGTSMSLLSGAWSFATSRLGSTLLAGALCFGAGFHVEAKRAAERHALEMAQAEHAHAVELQRQADATRQIAEAATERARADAEKASSLQEKVDEYKAALDANKNPVCSLSDDDVRRLRDITAGTGNLAPKPPRAPAIFRPKNPAAHPAKGR